MANKHQESQFRYGITRRVLGCKDFVTISKEEFEDVLVAKNGLFTALGIEEKYDLLAENYAEFESDLLHITLRNMMFMDLDWSSARYDVNTINRRLANLLSACRMYVDHSKHDVSAIYGRESETLAKLKAAFANEYDSRIGYCLLETLRNLIQHSKLPLSILAYPSTREFPGNKHNQIKHTCVPKISVSNLKNSPNVKKTIFDRIAADADLLDIRPLVRDYLSGLGTVHEALRGWMSSDVKSWKQTLNDAVGRYTDAYGECVTGLAVVERDGRNVSNRYAELFHDFISQYELLCRKHMMPRHYSKQFVSSEADEIGN